jgi:hypothetical protein
LERTALFYTISGFEIWYVELNASPFNTDENILFIQDSRNEVTFGFCIRQLAPDNSDIAIQGNFNVTLLNTAIINGGANESVSCSIWVVDRAGNESNRINSSAIIVNAQ